MMALKAAIKACRSSMCTAIGREQLQESNDGCPCKRLLRRGQRFGIAADPPCTEQEKQLTAWGYAFIGLGYLAIMEAMYLAYKRYNADVGKMQYGLAREDALWHKPSTKAAGVDLDHVPPSDHTGVAGCRLTSGDAKERLLRIHEVIQDIADKTGSYTAYALFLDKKSTPEVLRKLVDEINKDLRSRSKPELSLTALTGEAAHKMKEIVQKFKEALKEGAMRQGPLEDDERFYFIDPDLDLVIEYI